MENAQNVKSIKSTTDKHVSVVWASLTQSHMKG
jgi:hypothetical protein